MKEIPGFQGDQDQGIIYCLSIFTTYSHEAK